MIQGTLSATRKLSPRPPACSRLAIEVIGKPLTARNGFVHSLGTQDRSEWAFKVHATFALALI